MVGGGQRYFLESATPLHLVAGTYRDVKLDHLQVVRLLLDRGADIEARSKHIQIFYATPLHVAAEEGHVEVFRLLLTGEPISMRRTMKARHLFIWPQPKVPLKKFPCCWTGEPISMRGAMKAGHPFIWPQPKVPLKWFPCCWTGEPTMMQGTRVAEHRCFWLFNPTVQ